MTKKEKKKKKKDKKESEEKGIADLKLSKFDALTKIDELTNLAHNYKMQGNYEEAIRTSGKIVELALQFDLPSYIKEQDDFLKSIAKEVQKDHIIREIMEYGEKVIKQFNELVEEDNIESAHKLVKAFKEKYVEIPYFDKIPIINKLIERENKTWIQYKSRGSEIVEKHKKIDEKEEFLDLLKELKK
ncbi:MAG: hypothetical protein ACP6IY_01465 [Promethearchaeia archaeon]